MARSKSLGELRAAAEVENARISLPKGCAVSPLDGLPASGERIAVPGADATAAILYHHGGGHVFGSPATHRHLVARLAEAAGIVAFNMGYSLAPERPYPAGVEDSLANYRFVLDQGIAPERIIVAGDSAGGNLTLAMLIRASEAGLPLPGGIHLISPWVDLRDSEPHAGFSFDRDPLIVPEALRAWSRAYCGNSDASESKISPLLADLTGFPPTLVQVGGAELLLRDSLAFTNKLALAGATVQLNVWRDQLHAWPLFHADLLLAGCRAITQAGYWMRQILARSR